MDGSQHGWHFDVHRQIADDLGTWVRHPVWIEADGIKQHMMPDAAEMRQMRYAIVHGYKQPALAQHGKDGSQRVPNNWDSASFNIWVYVISVAS